MQIIHRSQRIIVLNGRPHVELAVHAIPSWANATADQKTELQASIQHSHRIREFRRRGGCHD